MAGPLFKLQDEYFMVDIYLINTVKCLHMCYIYLSGGGQLWQHVKKEFTACLFSQKNESSVEKRAPQNANLGLTLTHHFDINKGGNTPNDCCHSVGLTKRFLKNLSILKSCTLFSFCLPFFAKTGGSIPSSKQTHHPF